MSAKQSSVLLASGAACLKNYAHILPGSLVGGSSAVPLLLLLLLLCCLFNCWTRKKFVTSQKAFEAAKIQHFVKMSNETCHLSCPGSVALTVASPRPPSNASVCHTHTHTHKEGICVRVHISCVLALSYLF